MSAEPVEDRFDDLVRRGGPTLRPDVSRVLLRPFLPGQELVSLGVSRAEAVVSRVLALDDAQVRATLAETLRRFSETHPDLRGTFRAHAAMLPPDLPGTSDLSGERADLVGAYMSQEYAIEGAAILNPSMVAHPDQSALGPGEARFVMSVRAIGEGHVSSLEFRTGVISADGSVRVDEPATNLSRGQISRRPMSVAYLREALQDLGAATAAEPVLRALPEEVTPQQLDAALLRFELRTTPRVRNGTPLELIRRVAEICYGVEFSADSAISERVLFPASAGERNGIEDVRFVRFVDEDETVSYRATYTAYDGASIAPHLLQTADFRTFQVCKLLGPAANDKGMALFPRRIGGRFWSLSRWDRESICAADSADGLRWSQREPIQAPQRTWELIQLGTCSPPIETEQGWLVITHGVGPVRQYSLGALLLDLDDPTTVLGLLPEPLLAANEEERFGYVPNVVYSCGALVHRGTLVLPYGCSDCSVRFATADLDALVQRILAFPPPGSG